MATSVSYGDRPLKYFLLVEVLFTLLAIGFVTGRLKQCSTPQNLSCLFVAEEILYSIMVVSDQGC